MESSAPFSCTEVGLAELIRSGRFKLPWHQRNYDWDTPQVEEMLDDFKEIFSQKEDYFLGVITLDKEENSDYFEIIDGQQRIVTFSLICAYLGHILQDKTAYRIVFDFNEGESHENKDRRFRPPTNDEQVYRAITDLESGISYKGSATSKLASAWRTIQKYEFSEQPDKETLGEYLSFLLNNIYVARIDVENLDSNVVFEAINARGRHLSEFDLIRNKIYSYFSKQREDVQNEIHSGIELVRDTFKSKKNTGDNPANNYAKCYFQAKYGFYSERSLYKKVRTNLKNLKPIEIEQVVKDFINTDQMDLYRAVGFDGEISNSLNSSIANNISLGQKRRPLQNILFELRDYTVAHPLLFSLLYHLRENGSASGNNVYTCIKLLNSFIIRRAILSDRFSPGPYGNNFAVKAEGFWRNGLDDVNEFNDFIRDECDTVGIKVTNDTQFTEGFIGRQFKSSSPKTRTLLYGLNQFLDDPTSSNDRNFQIEHILPHKEKFDDGWDGFKGDDGSKQHEDYRNRIGNLTLLRKGENNNSDEFNRNGLNAKLEIYKNCAAKLTRNIEKDFRNEEWSPTTIEKREKQMAALATKVWNFDI